MLSPAWLGVFVIMYGLVIVSVVLATYFYCRRRMESIIKDASSLVDLTAKKQGLEADIEQCMKSLELKKLEAEGQKQESLREDLAKDLQNVVSAFKQEVTDLTAKKQRLDGEIEQCMKSLDENREEIRKLDGERQKQESLREDLANLSSQVAEEKQKRDEYRKEAEDLQNVISALSQDVERLESGKADQEIKNDVAKEELENAEEDKPIVKLRVVRKHKLRT